jgi:hypothetical protein
LLDAQHHAIVYACAAFFIAPLLSPDGQYLVTWEDGRQHSIAPYLGSIAQINYTENLTVYAAPNSDSEVLATYHRPEKWVVKLLDKEENFWYVALPDGTEGWLNTDLIGLREPRDPVFQIWRVPQP